MDASDNPILSEFYLHRRKKKKIQIKQKTGWIFLKYKEHYFKIKERVIKSIFSLYSKKKYVYTQSHKKSRSAWLIEFWRIGKKWKLTPLSPFGFSSSKVVLLHGAQFAAKLKICTESTSLQSRRTWTVKDWVKIGDLKARGDDETLLWASNVAVNEKFATGFDTATLRGFKLSR